MRLNEVLLHTSAGGWGEETESNDSTKVRIIRGADFPDAALRSIENCPIRYETTKRIADRECQTDDIILETSGGTSNRPTGRTILVSDDLLSQSVEPVIPASFCRLVRIDRSKASPKFIFWALQYFYLIGLPWEYQNRSTGISNFQFPRFSNDWSIPDKSYVEQEAIAEVLGALDDKIAANRKLRSTIRSFGSTITQRTTLTSGVPATIDDIAMFSNRKRIPLSASQRELRPGTVPYWGANGRMGWVDEPIFNEQLVLVGEDGSVVTDAGTPVIHNVWGPCWVNNHAHVLTGTSVSTDLLYFLMRSAQIAAKVTGAVQPKLSMTNLKSVELRIPAKEDLGTLEATIQPLMARYRQAAEESQTLASLRDTLLPALMDGTIRVKDAETHVEEVL